MLKYVSIVRNDINALIIILKERCYHCVPVVTFVLHENQKGVSIVADDTDVCFGTLKFNISQFLISYESKNCHKHKANPLSINK